MRKNVFLHIFCFRKRLNLFLATFCMIFIFFDASFLRYAYEISQADPSYDIPNTLLYIRAQKKKPETLSIVFSFHSFSTICVFSRPNKVAAALHQHDKKVHSTIQVPQKQCTANQKIQQPSPLPCSGPAKLLIRRSAANAALCPPGKQFFYKKPGTHRKNQELTETISP